MMGQFRPHTKVSKDKVIHWCEDSFSIGFQT
jgi:hypothetical protein